MKIAIIFSGNINFQTGKFNHVFRRFKAFNRVTDVEIDAFLIQKTQSKSFRALKKIKTSYEDYVLQDGLKIKNLWLHQSLWDYLSVHKLKLKDMNCKSQVTQYVNLFKNYDVLSTNDLLSSYLACLVKEKYHIPFSVVWHGSDINAYPYRSKKTYKLVKKLLQMADYNFFVSKNLKRASKKIAQGANKSHLYIGPTADFYKKSTEEKTKLRDYYKLQCKYIIGFVGNLNSNKNIKALAPIFDKIQQSIPDTEFLIVGNGSLKNHLELDVQRKEIKNIRFIGKIAPKQMPDIMNILDIMVLPSLKEGLGLVSIEAQKCGVHVVGSNAGGIPETIDSKNSIPLDENFEINFSNRVIEIIKNKETLPPMPNEFSLEKAIQKELKTYKKIASK